MPKNVIVVNLPTMIDTSYFWEDLSLLTKSGGISLG